MGIRSKVGDILYNMGRNIGNRIFTVLKANKSSPKIEQQREPYVDQIGRSFIAFLAIIYGGPFFLYFYGRVMGLMRLSTAPDTLMYDMMYFTPPFSYEAYGSGIILAGSVTLGTRLFNNFLFEEVERGTLLAMAHSGVAYLFAGTMFQIHQYFDTDVSEPKPELWILSPTEVLPAEMISSPVRQIEDIQYSMISEFFWGLYYFIENFEYIAPFIIPPLTGIWLTIMYRLALRGELQDYEQLEITSDKWEKQLQETETSTEEFNIDLEQSNAQIWWQTTIEGEDFSSFEVELQYQIDDDIITVSKFLYALDEEKDDSIKIKDDFPDFLSIEDALDYSILYFFTKGDLLLDRFCEYHTIEKDDEDAIVEHYIGEVPARVIEYNRPDPLDDTKFINKSSPEM